MRRQFSMTAMAVVLAATAMHSADARPRHVQSVGCGAEAMGSDARDANGSCLHTPVAGTRVRLDRPAPAHELRVAQRGASCGGSLSTVRARSGATACVTSSAAGNFQAFVSALESTGYRIDFMGGWRRHGSCRSCDMHPRGLAIDINQTGRNRVTRGFPSGVTALAEQHGLLHGAVWAHADTGHFELMSASPTRYARRSTAPSGLPDAVLFAQSTTGQGSGYH